MKKELFDYTKEEAQAFMMQEGIRELDYVQDDGYKLFGESVSATVKLRIYEDGEAKVEIRVPNKLQCVPCGVDYITENKDCCPVCETTNRDIMLRNKTFEEPFRRFEGIYSAFMTASLKVARPLCAWISDNYTQEQAVTEYEAAKEERDQLLEDLKPFGWIFSDNILDHIEKLKSSTDNVKAMKEIMGDDSSDKSLLEFKA